ncbi:hypothetical protein E2C01_002398 [Portunus trituberculatus]|uniref:Uncharacterized protein n=1 Tax=Portunus trituberculatus TaxID=210409 RepID=A0A5B7CKA3_PORTR|nr:hypothetical protein [Portunus trituberculatus]
MVNVSPSDQGRCVRFKLQACVERAESDTLASGPSVSLSVAAGVDEVWGGRGREPPRSCIGEINCSNMIALGSLRPLRTSFDDESFSPARRYGLSYKRRSTWSNSLDVRRKLGCLHGCCEGRLISTMQSSRSSAQCLDPCQQVLVMDTHHALLLSPVP